MLDTGGPEIRVCNRTGRRIELKADNHITFTPDVTKEPTSEVLPINYQGLAAVCFAYAFTFSKEFIVLPLLILSFLFVIYFAGYLYLLKFYLPLSRKDILVNK